MPQPVYRLISYHGTALYLDTDSLRLCHAPSGIAPENLVIELAGNRCQLVWVDIGSNQRSQLTIASSQGHVHVSREPTEFNLNVRRISNDAIAIEVQDKFLSSDDDGLVRIDRPWCREWEHYTLQRLETITVSDGKLGCERTIDEQETPTPTKISGFVICYNRAKLVETCLKSIRFVDELVVIDKSSTDGTAEIARHYADKFVEMPWSPSVEETRSQALGLCSHDLLAFLDDDECFSPGAIRFMLKEAENPSADVYSMPFHSYYLGRFDTRRRDWPEYHERFFRRGAIAFPTSLHSSLSIVSSRRKWLPADSSIFVYHFSYASVGEWIEKTNRYTSQLDRSSWFDESATPSAEFIRARTDYWLGIHRDSDDPYVIAYAMLRLVYDFVDLLKRWEGRDSIDAAAALTALRSSLQAEYEELGQRKSLSRTEREK